MSKRGLCPECGRRRQSEALDALHYHRGEGFKDWRRRVAASVGAVLVDDILDAE